MTDIEVIKYFTNHHRFNGEVMVTGANEIIAKTDNKDNFYNFAFFDEIRRNIERDYTVKNSRTENNLHIIVKCED